MVDVTVEVAAAEIYGPGVATATAFAALAPASRSRRGRSSLSSPGSSDGASPPRSPPRALLIIRHAPGCPPASRERSTPCTARRPDPALPCARGVSRSGWERWGPASRERGSVGRTTAPAHPNTRVMAKERPHSRLRRAGGRDAPRPAVADVPAGRLRRDAAAGACKSCCRQTRGTRPAPRGRVDRRSQRKVSKTFRRVQCKIQTKIRAAVDRRCGGGQAFKIRNTRLPRRAT